MESLDILGCGSEDVYLPDHDELCAIQAGQLLNMGCLEYETSAYACAFFKNQKVYYYISGHDESIRSFCQEMCLQGIYHTPIRYFGERFDLLDLTKEETDRKFRLETAYKIKKDYPQQLFQAVYELTMQPSLNKGYEVLQAAAERLENCFDPHQIDLFENLLLMLLKGRLINIQSYRIMLEWVKKEYRKMAIEPLKNGLYQRQYAGFVYEDKLGRRGHFADATLYNAEKKQEFYKNKGYLVTPILKITYYADSYINPLENRTVFLSELDKYLNDDYLRFMRIFAQMGSTINTALYNEWAEKIALSGVKEAMEAFRTFGIDCHVFE